MKSVALQFIRNMFKKSAFKRVNESWYCVTCSDTINPMYNPFRNLNGLNYKNQLDNNESDRFYDSNIEDILDDLTDASGILENCKSFKSIS